MCQPLPRLVVASEAVERDRRGIVVEVRPIVGEDGLTRVRDDPLAGGDELGKARALGRLFGQIGRAADGRAQDIGQRRPREHPWRCSSAPTVTHSASRLPSLSCATRFAIASGEAPASSLSRSRASSVAVSDPGWAIRVCSDAGSTTNSVGSTLMPSVSTSGAFSSRSVS